MLRGVVDQLVAAQSMEDVQTIVRSAQTTEAKKIILDLVFPTSRRMQSPAFRLLNQQEVEALFMMGHNRELLANETEFKNEVLALHAILVRGVPAFLNEQSRALFIGVGLGELTSVRLQAYQGYHKIMQFIQQVFDFEATLKKIFGPRPANYASDLDFYKAKWDQVQNILQQHQNHPVRRRLEATGILVLGFLLAAGVGALAAIPGVPGYGGLIFAVAAAVVAFVGMVLAWVHLKGWQQHVPGAEEAWLHIRPFLGEGGPVAQMQVFTELYNHCQSLRGAYEAADFLSPIGRVAEGLENILFPPLPSVVQSPLTTIAGSNTLGARGGEYEMATVVHNPLAAPQRPSAVYHPTAVQDWASGGC